MINTFELVYLFDAIKIILFFRFIGLLNFTEQYNYLLARLINFYFFVHNAYALHKTNMYGLIMRIPKLI